MMRRVRALMPAARSEGGFSLIETMVTMMLLGLILLMASSMYISVVRTTDNSQAVNEGTRVAANAMNEVNRVLRFAVDSPRTGGNPLPAFSVAKGSELVLYSLVDVDGLASTATRPLRPVMVKFALESDGNIVERRWEPNPSGQFWSFGAATNTTAVSSRVLGGKFLATGTDESLFRYLDAHGVEMIPVGNASLTSAQRKQIASVLVTMNTVPLNGPDDHPVIITNNIGMLNLQPDTGGD